MAEFEDDIIKYICTYQELFKYFLILINNLLTIKSEETYIK